LRDGIDLIKNDCFLCRMTFKLKTLCSLYLTFVNFGCFSPNNKLITSTADEESSWMRAFDLFVQASPQCPNGKHTLVEGQKSYPKFSGSCFECRRPLGITETKINKFSLQRTTTLARVYTCANDCKYNVCESCAKR
jgi:hypothetical protein